MDGFVGFLASLRHSYYSFVKDLSTKCKQVVRHHLDSVTSPYSLVCYQSDIPGSFDSGVNSISRANQISTRSFALDLSAGRHMPRREIIDEQENIPPGKEETTPGKVVESREALKECNMTVPETPSPDQQCDGNYVVKKELGNCVEIRAKKRPRIAGNNTNLDHVRTQNGGALMFCGGAGSRSGSAYTDICLSAAQHFAGIREVLIERGVASSLNSGFLTPWYYAY